MIGFLATLWCFSLAKELWPDAPFSRLLNAHATSEPSVWLTAQGRGVLVQLIVATILYVATRDLVPGSIELTIFYAANAGPVFVAVVATALVAAGSCLKAGSRSQHADLSFWQVRALDVSNQTFGKCARRPRGNASAGDNDDAAPEFAVAA